MSPGRGIFEADHFPCDRLADLCGKKGDTGKSCPLFNSPAIEVFLWGRPVRKDQDPFVSFY